MIKLIIPRLVCTLFLVWLTLVQTSAQVEIVPEKPDGIYTSGDNVTWTVKVTGETADFDSFWEDKVRELVAVSGHQNRKESQKSYQVRRDEVWLPALKSGKDMPDK